jgi:hypothetical protein
MRVASSPRAAQRSSENQYGLVSSQTCRRKDLVVIGRRVLLSMLVVLGQVIGHPVLFTPRVRPGGANCRAGESPTEAHATTVNQVCRHGNCLDIAGGVAIHGAHEFE